MKPPTHNPTAQQVALSILQCPQTLTAFTYAAVITNPDQTLYALPTPATPIPLITPAHGPAPYPNAVPIEFVFIQLLSLRANRRILTACLWSMARRSPIPDLLLADVDLLTAPNLTITTTAPNRHALCVRIDGGAKPFSITQTPNTTTLLVHTLAPGLPKTLRCENDLRAWLITLLP